MNASPTRDPGDGDSTPWFYRTAGVLLAPLERKLGIDCRRFTRPASQRMDGPLGPRERLASFVHRLICSLCRVQEYRSRRLHDALNLAARRKRFDADTTMPDDAKERLRQRLLSEPAEGADGERS